MKYVIDNILKAKLKSLEAETRNINADIGKPNTNQQYLHGLLETNTHRIRDIQKAIDLLEEFYLYETKKTQDDRQ